ncbi:MAG TPA: hypothetical protein VIL04_07995 [Solirubrobacterales bacterium]
MATAAVGAGIVLATGVATGTPDEASSSRIQVSHERVDTTLRPVSVPSTGAPVARAAAARAKKKRVRIKYFETQEFNIGNGDAVGDELRCPKKHKVLGGYFGSEATDVALTSSLPMSARSWFVGITKFGGIEGEPNPAAAILGIVCAQNVR